MLLGSNKCLLVYSVGRQVDPKLPTVVARLASQVLLVTG
jgi:hypothetical protein